MRRFACAVSLITVLLALSVVAAQQSANTAVPSLINYGGTIRDAGGNAAAAVASRTLGVTFAIYKQQEGGAPLWQETQNVVVSAAGRYSVLLGSTLASGLPSDLFSPAEQRWLGVQVEGQPEQARVLLVSVPYAMKAAEADTLAGHSASEFVTTDTLQSAVKEQVQQQTQQPSSSRTTTVGASPTLTTDPYVDNGTTLQTGTNFNIDGTGTAATLNAVNQFQLNGAAVVSVSGYLSQSLGLYAGQGNTGNLNTFAGFFAGSSNTSGAFNTVVGAQANNANQTGNYNTIVGAWAGLNNTGTNNAFYGAYAGYSNTTGVNNMFFGTNAGNKNTTGNGNFFLGAGSGYNNTTGINNTFLGYLSGQNADPTASNNLYIASQGAPGENGTIHIGDPANQTAAYIAGVSGANTNNGVPVFIDPTGKLGTAGNTMGLVASVFGRSGIVTAQVGDYNFSQINGVLQNSQLGGAYSSSVALSNSANLFTGSFTGNGSGLNGVNPAPGSFNYIQNTNLPQTANFNVSGNGTVGGLFTAQTGMLAINTTNSTAIFAQDNNTSGQSAAIQGQTFNPTGAGVDGQAKAATGYSVGVQGENDSTIGAGVIGVNDTTSGQNFGVLGYTKSTSGFGVMGASSGGVGTAGSNQTCSAFGSCTLTTGIAGQFFTQTGGTLLQGLSGSGLTSLAQVFAVDSAGNVTALGIPTKTVSGVAVYVDSNGNLGVQKSSGRFKEQVRDMGDSTDALMKLRPVTYFYKPQYDDGTRTLQYGLIAEEVARVYPELVAYEPDGKPYTVKYQYLATMLLNELQKQHAVVEAQREIVTGQQAEIDSLRNELQRQRVDFQERLTSLEGLIGRALNAPQSAPHQAEGQPAAGLR